MSLPVSDLVPFVTGLYKDVRDVLYETAVRVKERMAVAGKPISYPVQWDSEKQRRAFFATDGFGGGIPYQRKGRYEASFQVQRYELGTRVFSDHPSGAVAGMPHGWQSRIHRNRYPHLVTVLFEELTKIPQEISNKFSVRSNQ